MEKIHIGKIIKKELVNQNLGVIWLANQICLHRTSVYAIFDKESINTELLLRISVVLKKNLFETYYNHLNEKFPSTQAKDE